MTQWYCTRQRAGPLVKECRALRPRLCADDDPWERRDKQAIIKSPHSAVCRTQADRLELRLALMGYDGHHYTLTFDEEHLPATFRGVRMAWRAFTERAKRWHGGAIDWIYAIEGKHGDHRYHIHVVLRYSQFAPAEVQHLWKYGMVDDEPVLRMRIRKDPQTGQTVRTCDGGFRRLAEYLCKERTDGIIIPIGRHPWSCSRTLAAQLPQPERWKDDGNLIRIPDNVVWSIKSNTENSFGAYYFSSWICDKPFSGCPENDSWYFN